MNLKKFLLKIKAFRLRKILRGDGKKKKESHSSRNLMKASWMTPVSHGYRIVEDPIGKTPNISDCVDSVVVQRDQIQEQEVWFFGVFNSNVVSDQVSKYLQTNLFDGNNKEVLVRRSKGVLRKAHLNARTMVKEKHDNKQSKKTREMNGTSAIVINGEKLIIACMGGYRAVICRDGKAFPATNNKRQDQEITKPHWSQKFIPGFFIRKPREDIISHCSTYNNCTTTTERAKNPVAKISSKPQLHVASERIDPSTEFVILASTGIWEVMKDQEAVNLISHIGDPQESAECLTNEAITRTSRSNISCLVIRFDHFT